MESLKENLSQARQSLLELENLYKDGKDKYDTTVKATEEKIRVALDVPRESWINTGQPLKDHIEHLHRQLVMLESPSFSSEMISDKDVLKNASGGLALEGVYDSRNLEDLLGKREQLIAIPESFSLTSPKQNSFYVQKEFSSYKSQSIYEKVIEKLGFSFSSSLKIGCGNFSLGFAIDRNELTEAEKTGTNSREESYILQTMHNYIPLACCFIEKDKLVLSDGAINALKEIEMVILLSNKCKVQTNKVRDFYERFGSHVNQGPIHFGGIFWWRASAAGFSSSSLSEIKRLTSDALNTYIGAAYSGAFLNVSLSGATSYAQLKGSFTGKHNEDLMSQVHLSIRKTGGPAEVDNHLQWKSLLATRKRTWSVIDRGTTLIPVWEILMAAHKDDFNNVFNLSRILMEAYTDITKVNVEKELEEDIFEVERAKKLIQSVTHWSASECESHLTDLLELKTRLIEKTGSHNAWIQICLSNPMLQSYLVEVATVNQSSKHLSTLMSCLLEPDTYKVENFRNRRKIMNWIYHQKEDKDISVSEFSEFFQILESAKKELEDSRHAFSTAEQDFSAKKNATRIATLSLNSFCKTLRENDQEETELLVVSIATVLGYNREQKTFDHALNLNEINFFQTNLQKTFSDYSSLKDECATRAQAYLFLTALTLSTDNDMQISNKEKRKRLQLIETNLKDNTSIAIKSVIENSQDNWQLLENALHSIRMGTHNSDERAMSEETVFHLENMLPKQIPSLSEVQHKEEQNTPAKNIAGEKMDSFMNLLQRLGLRDSYPKKISKREVLVIDNLSLSVNRPTTEKELSKLYLYKLLTLDYQARYLHVKPEAVTMSLNDDDVIFEDDDDFYDTGDTSIQSVSCKQEQIHPMDIQMAIFHCSSDILRQYIFTKLSACQFSLPILVPNPCTEEIEFPLWALRHIRKSWKSKNGSTSGRQNNRDMFNTPVPIVSFIRLGSSNYNSKSQILNGVISKHNVFFHRHCSSSSTSDSLLMNGVVEIAWYCPGGKENEIFHDCVAFMNLHGNAAEHPKQFEFLQAVSTVNVLLLSEHSMGEAEKEVAQKLSKSPVPLICLFSGIEHIQQSKNPRKVKLAAKNRKQAEFTDELSSQIKQCICLNKQMTSIEGCCEAARRQQFKVDEDQKSCQDAYSQVRKLTCPLKEGNISTLKDRFLSLQGELWHEWCRKNKEQYRLQHKTESIEKQKSEISAKMTNIRSSQLKNATPLNEFMRSFLECFTPSLNTEETILFKLQWLRILLDDLTTDPLAKLGEDYQSTWRKLQNVPNGKEKISIVNQLHKELNGISGKMTTTAVGLQHLMREVGQLYEVIQMSAKAKEHIQYTLPEIGVKMLLSGYPLELMDGDAACVPIKWIEAVMDELIETVGDRKVLVLSILGLQSSGKSTLLNTMFGVQFSVSAGRCTRGALMQLIPVESSIRNQLGYDFVLIVDTEGLRSPELSTKQSVNHDNELATFIIGIGDITVINIMGENPSDIQDILQICVQAFLRMKQVKISPSCIFVHQNCAETSVGDKNMEGRRCLLQKLDGVAKMAAMEENIEGISSFSEVISFDVETQVFYFKNLLEGDPPMAPPNPSYSQNVQELKTKLLTVAKWQRNRNFSSLSKFRWRVSDLWKGLLQENFVFSFRNTVEMMVYSSLEEKYAAWSWELRKYSMEHQNELRNQIGSNLIQVVNVEELKGNFDRIYNPLLGKIEKYFTEDKDKETLKEWHANIKARFEVLRDELINGILKKCKELLTSKNSRSKLHQSKYTDELTRQSKKLASNPKMKLLEEEQVNNEFDKLWASWTTEMLETQPPEEPVIVKSAVETILLEKFKKHPKILHEVEHAKKTFEFNKKKHMQQALFERVFNTSNFLPDFQNLNQQLMHKMQEYITAKENENVDFDENFIYEMLSDIEEAITTFEKNKELTFSNAFKVGLSVHLCLKYVLRFQKMHDDFKKANHPLTYLQSQRDKYLQLFKHYCKGASSVTIFADFFCKHIKSEVLKAANEKISQQIADKMNTDHQAFNGNRSKLDKHILKHLATKECIEFYEEYIDFPERYFERFITENVETFCADIGSLHTMHQESLGKLKSQIIIASTEVTREMDDRNDSASTWLTDICKKVGKLIVIDRDALRSIEHEHIGDWQFLKERMATSLEDMVKDEKTIDMGALKKKCTGILLQQLQGCWAKCPFCKAVCTNTIPDHKGDHSVQFHRCEALSGQYWEGTDNFDINFCTTAVSSDLRFKSNGERFNFKTYKDAGDPYNTWDITPDCSVQRYWKWFICTFQKQWEQKYGRRFAGYGEIPKAWKEIKKESAFEEL